jgi:RNA polymerase sigma-32 factor
MTAPFASQALVPGGQQALALGFSGSLGNLDAYISAVNRLPLLSHEEEISLAQRLRDQNDLAAAQALVMSHLRLVVSIARGYLGYGLPHADLIQEGNVGLMKAVKRFDPDQGVRLVSYAMQWIKAEMHEYILRNWRMVKLATTKAQRKLFFNLRSHKTGLDTMTPDQVSALATTLNVKPEEVTEMEMRLSGRDIALESPTDEDADDKFSPIAYLSSDLSEPAKVLESRQFDKLQSEGLELALSNLDARSRRIIESRWLANDDGSGATLHELAEFNVSAERVRQIEASALKKMKASLAEYA